MPLHPGRLSAIAWFIALGLPLTAAQAPQDSTKDSTRDPRTAAQRAAKGPLPDPALLDGSKYEAEKRSEYGMLGEFEIPGDETQSDRVGGRQSSQAGQQDQQKQNQSGLSVPQSGGAPGGAQQQQQMAGGAAGAGSPNEGAQAKAGGAGAAEQNGTPGAAEGIEVAGLQGEASPAAAGGQAGANKPQQVALGDSAMQIKPQPNAPNVVGAQQPVGKDVPQAYDKNTPGGGKQSGGRGNQGVEKGRVMPSGL
jgi:hypothetical protein